MLNLNLCLKVEDSGPPLSFSAVKVSFQIKGDLFDLPSIVFSNSKGLKMESVIFDQPPLPILPWTHTYTAQTVHILWHVLWSSYCSLIGNRNNKEVTNFVSNNEVSNTFTAESNTRGCQNPLLPLHVYFLFHFPLFTCCPIWQKDPAAGFYLTRAP